MDIPKLVQEQRAYFLTDATLSYEFRMDALEKLRQVITENEDAIYEAMHTDLGKAPQESYMCEVGLVLSEIDTARKHLHKWMRPKRVSTPVSEFLGDSHIYWQPYGTTLIIGTWNYPFQLTMEPLVGAIAAGNTVVLKPSDYSVATSKLTAQLLEKIFSPEYISVVLGNHVQTDELLDEHFDYIFFTGSKKVGRIVLEAAAKYTTPVTLELGGQSPCIVDETADIELAGKRIAWGKILNSGQTCVAPDYVYVHADKKDELMDALEKALDSFYPEGALKSPDYPHMINEKEYERVVGLFKDVTIAKGGHTNPETLQIEPSLLTDVTWESPVMGEEIFGPLLPIMTYTDLNDVIKAVNAHPEPLATYIFSENEDHIDAVRDHIRFGGGCVNDVVVHVASDTLPFGGVGASGMGCYHGRFTFETFSHKKGIVRKSNAVDLTLRYPPYTKKNFERIRTFLH